MDDRLTSPELHIDGPVAVVWARYKFTIGYVEEGVTHAPALTAASRHFSFTRQMPAMSLIRGTKWDAVNVANRIDRRVQSRLSSETRLVENVLQPDRHPT